MFRNEAKLIAVITPKLLISQAPDYKKILLILINRVLHFDGRLNRDKLLPAAVCS
jgi:hypothetical protein